MSVGKNIDWENVGLGTEPDQRIADRLGVDRRLVGKARQKLGIPSVGTFPRETKASDWKMVGLGTETDRTVAKRLGVSNHTVRKNCTSSEGVPSFQSQQHVIDWSLVPLGKETDQALATKLGVTRMIVQYERHRLGITTSRSRKNLGGDTCPPM